MIHNPEYVKELIKKRLDDSITPVENVRLEAARQIYDEDEFMGMVAEVMEANQESLKEDSLRHWRPDFQQTIDGGGDRRRGGWLLNYIQVGLVAAVIALLLSIGYVMRRQAITAPLIIGDCAGIRENQEIPSSEFAATMFGSDLPATFIAASNSGSIVQMGNISVDKTQDGVVRLALLPDVAPSDSGLHYIALTTAARQQCVVELPGGTRIRLNAGSALQYNLSTRDGKPTIIRFTGEARVQVPSQETGLEPPFIMETSNSRLIATTGDFVVRTDPGRTNALLLEGEMNVENMVNKQRQRMDCPGDMAIVSRTVHGPDTLHFHRDGPINAALSWTKAKRTYKNVPLRQFVLEASRWHGFQIEDINCIPADKRINATLCYRGPKNDLFAAIQAAGVTMYEREGMLVFCPGLHGRNKG